MGQGNKLGIITYNAPHQKTDLVLSALVRRHDPGLMTLFCLPFQKRKERDVYFRHRPLQTISALPADYAAKYGMSMVMCQEDTDVTDDCDNYLILAGKLLSAQAIGQKKIINVHPGLIPTAKGLDAFKWSIYRQVPLGITMHYIDAEIDEGAMISQILTPVFASDTIESLAQRHYEQELQMTIEFSSYLQKPVFEVPPGQLTRCAATRRMPYDTEVLMVNSFGEYKKKFATL